MDRLAPAPVVETPHYIRRNSSGVLYPHANDVNVDSEPNSASLFLAARSQPSDSVMMKKPLPSEVPLPSFPDAQPAASTAGSSEKENLLSAELQQLYTCTFFVYSVTTSHAHDIHLLAFQRCLDIRDKYIKASKQRLEDNPANFDGQFDPEPDSTSTSTAHYASSAPSRATFPKWHIYPPHEPPHWVVDENQAPKAHVKTPYQPPEFDFKQCEIPGSHDYTYKMDHRGVFQIYDPTSQTEGAEETPLCNVPTLREFFSDLEFVLGVVSDGPAKSFAFRRMKYLESKWNMYILLNEYQELAEMKRVPHRDFYNVRKVDTHVHHSASMNQKHLLRFIKSKMKRSPDDIVIFRDGKHLTLSQVFQSLNLTAYDLSIDTLDMHAHQDSFHRFDRFNLKYSPLGESRLREIFLKTDNLIQGRYLAEITKENFADLQNTKYQMAEYRISIYGRQLDEWDKLARWVIHNKLFCDNVRWLIQVPRLYELYKKTGVVTSFQDVLTNLFQPLFEVTKDPSSHPELHIFLQRVVGIDSVDDESKNEKRLYRKYPFPSEWNTLQNPPYDYWLYYLYANMSSLNHFRHERGFNTFVLRPHCGEAGDPNHLVSAYLTAHSISHGILLRKIPALLYLYYLEQIGIAMSPLSNNALFLTYDRNPFPTYFKAGLNVSLSTDDPLQFSFTKEPLLEEYSVAAQIYKLSPADMCELARNSVLQSGWEMEIKRHWLGENFFLPGVAGNDIEQTNVPDGRIRHRYETLVAEREMIWKHSATHQDGKRSPAAVSRSSTINKDLKRPRRVSSPAVRRLHLTANEETVAAAAIASASSAH